MHLNFSLLVILLFLLNIKSNAQEAVAPRPSPLDIVSIFQDSVYIKINYGRPHANGRTVFGELVPFGEVWRTGANEATEITLTDEIKLAGNGLEAGTYALFTIPDSISWTIIINHHLGQWGSYNYNEKYDVLRFEVPPQAIEETYEAFTIDFERHGIDTTQLVLIWANTKIVIPIEFE